MNLQSKKQRRENEMIYADLNNRTDGLERIIDFLKVINVPYILGNGIEEEVTYNRNVTFTIFGIDYKILWFKNISTLIINPKDEVNSPRIPFNYMWLDECFPLVGGNRSIGFASKFPFEYENLRIPLPRK